MDSKTLSKQIAAYDKTAQNPIDIYNQAVTTLGIPDVRTRVSGLRGELMNTENLLKGVDSNVTARTSGSLVTEAQRQRLVNTERQPLTEQLNTVNQDFTMAGEDLKSLLGEATTQTDLTYEGQKNKRSNLADQLATALKRESEARRQKEADRLFKLKQKQQKEAERQFNLSYQQKAAAIRSGGGSGSSKKGASNTEKFASALAAAAGKDGKVSPGDYNSLKHQWVASGYGSYKQFHDKYWRFVNESHWWDYK